MSDDNLFEKLGHIEGKVDSLLSQQTTHALSLQRHIEAEERLLEGHDRRIRKVENRMHTTWWVGGGAIGAFGLTALAWLKHTVGW